MFRTSILNSQLFDENLMDSVRLVLVFIYLFLALNLTQIFRKNG